MTRNFISHLLPYRARNIEEVSRRLAACASGIMAKMPHPKKSLNADSASTGTGQFNGVRERDVKKRLETLDRESMLCDALALSRKFVMSEEGQKSVRCGEFTRYW